MIEPLISIVVPVYNAEKFIEKCLNSIHTQSYTNWECIVVNDGSHDNSGIICDKYSKIDHRFKIVHKENAGVGSARNLGIDMSKGQFITFIDSDDYVDSNYIADFILHYPCKKSIVINGMITKTPTEQYTSFLYANKTTLDGTTASNLIVKYDLFRDGGPVNKLFDLEVIRENNLRFRTDISYHEDHIFVYSYYLFIDYIILSGFCGYYYMYYQADSKGSLSRIGKRKVESLFKASDIFLDIVPRLFAKYEIEDELYKAKVLTRTGFSQRILALYNLYFYSSYPACKCKKILSQEKNFIPQIKEMYYPLSFKRKIILNILSLPVSISHPILFLMRKIKSQFMN